MRKHGAFRSRTRDKLKKDHRSKGKISISKFFQELKDGDSVILKGEPAYQKGMYYPRFHGKVGMVLAKRGDCFEVLIKDSKKEKLLIVHPVHLQKVEQA